jgi:RNA polymerase sigma factor (sigma-70 family)
VIGRRERAVGGLGDDLGTVDEDGGDGQVAARLGREGEVVEAVEEARDRRRLRNGEDPTIFAPLPRLQPWMKAATSLVRMPLEQDQLISSVVQREEPRLRNFIRRRVPDARDAEDILQEVFYELVEANRLLMPIDHLTGWLFRVARNRITDLFRERRPESWSDVAVADEDDELLRLEDLLPSPDAGPEAVYARHLLLAELETAVDELPPEQRDVFVAHELQGRSFKAMAAETGVSVNTLLSRKRYAVRHLRARLQDIYDEFTKA